MGARLSVIVLSDIIPRPSVRQSACYPFTSYSFRQNGILSFKSAGFSESIASIEAVQLLLNACQEAGRCGRRTDGERASDM